MHFAWTDRETVKIGAACRQRPVERLRRIVERRTQVGRERRSARHSAVINGAAARTEVARGQIQPMHIVGRIAIAHRLRLREIANEREISGVVIGINILTTVGESRAGDPALIVGDEVHAIAVGRRNAGIADVPFNAVGEANLRDACIEVDRVRRTVGGRQRELRAQLRTLRVVGLARHDVVETIADAL